MSEPLPLNELVALTRNEKQLLHDMGLITKVHSPSDSVVDRILNYSKALSIQKSTYGNFYFMNN